MDVLRFSKHGCRREIAFALAAILIVAATPAFCYQVAANSVPALTLDICHPAQSIGSPSAIVLAAAPSPWTAFAPPMRTRKPRTRHLLTARPNDRPETPPPKASA